MEFNSGFKGLKTSNKSERLMHLAGLIYLDVWWCTDLQTLNLS